MINEQNNIKVKDTTKVKNLRYNPYNPSRVGNTVNSFIKSTLKSLVILEM